MVLKFFQQDHDRLVSYKNYKEKRDQLLKRQHQLHEIIHVARGKLKGTTIVIAWEFQFIQLLGVIELRHFMKINVNLNIT